MDRIEYWIELETSFLNFLKEKGYTYEAIKHYKGITKLLVRYANATQAEAYTPKLGENFIASEERLSYRTAEGYRYERLVIRRMNEYVNDGEYSQSYLRVNYECPEPFRECYERYIAYLQHSGYKYNTIKQYRVFVAKLFQNFVSNGITDWNAVNAAAVADAFSQTTNKAMFATYVKRLFTFLVDERILEYNYSGILPKVQYWKRIPSVYSESEIGTILGSVDRSSDVGKRDYAILLLAARLGMRASDIRCLRFSEVNFEKHLIEFVQYKTKVPQQLRLLPEVADSLHDYIDNARGDSQEPYIFLTHRKSMRKPITAAVVTSATAKYFKESGIQYDGRHHGPHALRMSLASALVADNVPYDVVRTILGHEDPDAITHYVKIDVEQLRACALEVPSPSGRFYQYLMSGKENASNGKSI